jgi:hypothetical protein
MIAQPYQNSGDGSFAPLTRLHAQLHQPPQIGLRAHLPAERIHAVVVEPGFVQEGARLCGFALEGQLISPSF